MREIHDDRERPGTSETVEYELDADAEGLAEVDVEEAVADAENAVGLAELAAAREETARVRQELESLREVYLRKLAEFDNFRKRTEREKEELQRIGGENLIRELVPVLDNFNRALQHGDDVDPAAFRLGVEMIARQLRESLQRQGLEPIMPAGDPFDPEFHEAVQRVEGSEAAPGTVVDVLAQGYVFGGRLIRPALVSVAVEAAPSGDGTAAESEEDS
jgi:molecular chaperone GrpE